MAQLTPNTAGQIDRWHSYPAGNGKSIAVNERLANAILHRLPGIASGVKAADKFWKLVASLVFIGGFVALIWLPWWTPIVGFAVSMVLYRSALKSAADFVAQAAIKNPDLLRLLAEGGVVRVG